jgi:hypothetical protein
MISTAQTARKPHHCLGGYCRVIQPGERYWRHTATPNDGDLGNEGWWHSVECADCATRYGRPIPSAAHTEEQG